MDVQSHVHIDGEGLLLLHTCYENRTSHLLPHTNSSLTNTFAIIDLDVLCKLHFKHYKHHHIYIWLWYGPHEKRCCDCIVQKVNKNTTRISKVFVYRTLLCRTQVLYVLYKLLSIRVHQSPESGCGLLAYASARHFNFPHIYGQRYARASRRGLSCVYARDSE